MSKVYALLFISIQLSHSSIIQYKKQITEQQQLLSKESLYKYMYMYYNYIYSFYIYSYIFSLLKFNYLSIDIWLDRPDARTAYPPAASVLSLSSPIQRRYFVSRTDCSKRSAHYYSTVGESMDICRLLIYYRERYSIALLTSSCWVSVMFALLLNRYSFSSMESEHIVRIIVAIQIIVMMSQRNETSSLAFEKLQRQMSML